MLWIGALAHPLVLVPFTLVPILTILVDVGAMTKIVFSSPRSFVRRILISIVIALSLMVLAFIFSITDGVTATVSMILAEYYVLVYIAVLRRVSNGWTRQVTYDHWYMMVILFYAALFFWPAFMAFPIWERMEAKKTDEPPQGSPDDDYDESESSDQIGI
jgi:hypothetical protein